MLGGTISPYGQNIDGWVEQVKAVASNVISGTNPPYLIADFLSMYPQFGGAPIAATGTTTANSNQITGMSSITGIAVGMVIINPNVPNGTTVTAMSGLTVTMSANATVSGTGVTLTFYPLLVPLVVLQMYMSLANTCIIQARYKGPWIICMGLFIAHWLTLYLQGTASAGSPAAKVIAAGEAKGLRVSKSAGDISTSIDYNAVANDLEGWAAWKLTTYGTQFATIGKMVGKGGMMVY